MKFGVPTFSCIHAFNTALEQVSKNKKVIHHSDLCSKDYTDILRKRGPQDRYNRRNHCYENSVAERINKTLKLELGLYIQYFR